MNEEQKQAVRDAVASALGDAYDCQRVWSAWGVGTMSSNDFSLVAEDDERLNDITDAALAAMPAPFEARVQLWMLECFGVEIAADAQERNHRFLEEALELVQACGATQSEAHQLVDYVYGRPVGDKHQEVGGVMVTLAALCLAQDLDMHAAGEVELARIWTKVEQIRAKQAAKPNIVQIGQFAYHGENRGKICRSKAAAVRELRERGVKRDVARHLVNDVCKRLSGYATTRASEYGDVIEINARQDLA